MSTRKVAARGAKMLYNVIVERREPNDNTSGARPVKRATPTGVLGDTMEFKLIETHYDWRLGCNQDGKTYVITGKDEADCFRQVIEYFKKVENTPNLGFRLSPCNIWDKYVKWIDAEEVK